MYVHALHTMHAVPDLRVAAGRLRDVVSFDDLREVLIKTLSGSDNGHGKCFYHLVERMRAK